MKQIKSHKIFEGQTQFWSHDSSVTGTEMKFSTFIPSGEIKGCIIWLSGLTCNEENFITKAGAQKYLAEHQLMVIVPDTSPRGLNLPGEHDSYDFGSGAGFYVNAEVAPYKENYQMYSYINDELYDIVKNYFGQKKISIMGHSMGGHGALVLGLRNPNKYLAVSAFSPIVNPSEVPWGLKAFKGYLGEDKKKWEEYDACTLLQKGHKHPTCILIHQGLKDEFLKEQLKIDRFESVAEESGQKHEVNLCDDYDHSYYFIATFIEDHIKHHKKYLTS